MKVNPIFAHILMPRLWEALDNPYGVGLARIIPHHFQQIPTGVQIELELWWKDGTLTFERYIHED